MSQKPKAKPPLQVVIQQARIGTGGAFEVVFTATTGTGIHPGVALWLKGDKSSPIILGAAHGALSQPDHWEQALAVLTERRSREAS